MVVGFDVGFVVHFHQYIAVFAVEEPVGRVFNCPADGGFVFEDLVLAEVEVADDGDHAELVGAVEDAFEAGHEIGEESTIGGYAGGVPGLGFGVTFGAAALEIDGEGEKSVFAPEGHGGEELVDVSVGVPFLGVGVGPFRDGLRVFVVEDPLDHAGVHQETFDFMAFVSSPFVSWLSIDEELVAADFDFRFGRGGREQGWGGGEGEKISSGDHGS